MKTSWKTDSLNCWLTQTEWLSWKEDFFFFFWYNALLPPVTACGICSHLVNRCLKPFKYLSILKKPTHFVNWVQDGLFIQCIFFSKMMNRFTWFSCRFPARKLLQCNFPYLLNDIFITEMIGSAELPNKSNFVYN